MTNILGTFCKRFFGQNEVLHRSYDNCLYISESEKNDLRQKYIKWIHRRFLYIKFSLITDTEMNYNRTRVIISHWVPFMCDQINISPSEQLLHTWSDTQKSVNIQLLDLNHFQFHRNPVAGSTDAIRGKIGFSTGIHIWKITWPESMRGTHAVIGVATDKAVLQHNSYVSLIGFDKESWGWDIVSRKKVHDKMSGNPICSQIYPDSNKIHAKRYFGKHESIPETIYVILDMFQGTLSYMISDIFLGIAHSNLKGKTLYPSVSAVWGHCEVSISYMNNVSSSF